VHGPRPRRRVGGSFGRERSIGRSIGATFGTFGAFPPGTAGALRTVPTRETNTDDDALHSLHVDANKLADFEAYAHALRKLIERCGGIFVGYYLPTKVAGPTNSALGLIDFENLAAYEQYRAKLLADPDAVECLRRAEAAGCILNEDRAFVRRV
jgi:hypothetical protein